MKYIDEFRDPQIARRLVEGISVRSRIPVRLMEFCGGHTHAIMRYGIRQMLPPTVQLLSGPGCPVCVTANRDLDYVIALAQEPGVTVATFGDMIRVPGSHASLQDAKAEGADVRVVYSPLDALEIARRNPSRAVVFLGIGFETTAPAVASSILQAEAQDIRNYYVFCAHKLTPPATRAILEAGEVNLSGIIGPGHVTTITGLRAWEFLPRGYNMPCVIAGFEPLDILLGISLLVEMVESGRAEVGNAYGRSVQLDGNLVAQEIMNRVFEMADAEWRGLGNVSSSGLCIRPEFAHRDAQKVFPPGTPLPADSVTVHSFAGCRCGDILRGVILPTACPLFSKACTPAHPFGPCMVSAEGACAAYYLYRETLT